MKECELERAKREALKLFDDWNDVTGYFEPFSGYYGEMTSLIEDFVECGAAYATGNGEEFQTKMRAKRE